MPASSYPRPAFIAADLAAVPLMDALERAGAGFDRSKPALFTVEGLVSAPWALPLRPCVPH